MGFDFSVVIGSAPKQLQEAFRYVTDRFLYYRRVGGQFKTGNRILHHALGRREGGRVPVRMWSAGGEVNHLRLRLRQGDRGTKLREA